MVRFFSPLRKEARVKVDTSNVLFTKIERDSIYKLVKDLIDHPVQPTGFCTEYVGHLNLTISSHQIRRSCEYRSVCDWSKLSDTAALLNKILKRKVNIAH